MSTAGQTKSRVPKVLAPEAEAEVAAAFQGLVERWKPTTDIQIAALRTLAAARCYRQRVWQAITEVWDRILPDQDPAALIADPVGEVLARHDTRSQRRLHRAVEEVVSLFSAEKHTPLRHETHKRAQARH